MTLQGFLRSFGAMFRRPLPRKYNFDPVYPLAFDSRRHTTPCDEESLPRPGYVLRMAPSAPSVCKRSEQLSFSLAGIPALAIDAGAQTQVSITGTDADLCLVKFCAQAGGPNDDDARRSLEKITFARSDQLLKVSTPEYSRARPVGAWLQIDAARSLPIMMTGCYSYMELFGIDASVRVSTTHARLKMIDVSGDVQASAHVGIIDFAGVRGRINLRADGEVGEINLKFGAPFFDGTLNAEAEVAIRILLPVGFESPFEAIVDRSDLFVCRADIAPNVRRYDREGHTLLTYGAGDPKLRFVSHGILVIDSIGQPPSQPR